MFIETRTPDQVITDAWREVERLLNGVLSGVATRRSHPTYITKTHIRNDLIGARAALGLVQRLGDGTVPDAVTAKLAAARAAVDGL
jgi:hypothetical protein